VDYDSTLKAIYGQVALQFLARENKGYGQVASQFFTFLAKERNIQLNWVIIIQIKYRRSYINEHYVIYINILHYLFVIFSKVEKSIQICSL